MIPNYGICLILVNKFLLFFSNLLKKKDLNTWKLTQTGVLDLLATRTKGIKYIRFYDLQYNSVLKCTFCQQLLKRNILDSNLRSIEFIASVPIPGIVVFFYIHFLVVGFWDELFQTCPKIDHICIQSRDSISIMLYSFSKHQPLRYLEYFFIYVTFFKLNF
jgi:hypothetical protein